MVRNLPLVKVILKFIREGIHFLKMIDFLDNLVNVNPGIKSHFIPRYHTCYYTP